MIRLILLLAIAWVSTVHAEEESLAPKSMRQKMLDSYGSVLDNFKSSKSEDDIKKEHLWQAALDVISFMPIAVSDASGGVISTDWYEDVKTPSEKFKVNIIIKPTKLKSKSVSVTVFRKIFKDGKWHDIPHPDKVAMNMAADIMVQIFQKAKKLKS